MNYPENFEKKIGFDNIRNILKTKCLSKLGKNKVENINFLYDFSEIKKQVDLTDEFKEICIYEENFPVSYFIDVNPFLKKIKKMIFLDAWELFDIKRSMDTILAIINFFKKSKEEKYLNLKELVKDVKNNELIIKEINKILDKKGKIKDEASFELLEVRRNLRKKRSNISKKINIVLQKAKREKIIDKDTNLSVRDGKVVIPIDTNKRKLIKGFVLDESATGKTSYIEPIEIIEINNEIKVLEYAEKREIIKILIKISDFIRPHLDDLFNSYDFLADIDMLRAKAMFAIEINAIKPEILQESRFDLRQAIHPLLYLSFKKEKKKVVPLDIEIDKNSNIILISGPNAGGKSVCLKTVGLLQMMLQSGLLIPVGRFSKMGIFEKIFIDIGDEQSIENDLSTYSSHLLNMKFFTENANHRTLILIDEFGTGTEPILGGAIAEAILNNLKNRFVKGVITTHYTNLKHFASSHKIMQNAAMLFDTENMKPLFQLSIGKAGSSFAFEIAKNIGLSEDILKDATNKVGQKHIDYDKNLQKLENDKRFLENKIQRIERKERNLDKILKKYKKELDLTQREKKFIISEAIDKANEILKASNKKIENTIRKIKEGNAEKERTKKIRKELEDFKNKEIIKKEIEEEKINKKIFHLKKLEKQREEKRKEREEKHQDEQRKIYQKERLKEELKPLIKKEKIDPLIEKGDIVKIIGHNSEGEILEIKKKYFIVSFSNNLKTKVQKNKIVKTRNKFKKKHTVQFNFNMNTDLAFKRTSFKMGLDLRGKRGNKAIEILAKYIDEAIILEVNKVKILHGKGNGILRKMVREYLQKYPNLKCYDERPELGGAGITICVFQDLK